MRLQTSKNSSNHQKILGVKGVTWSKFHTQDPQLLGNTPDNTVTTGDLETVICALVCWLILRTYILKIF
jgi:hypothetical protein